MSIPIIVFLYLYLLFVLIWLIFSIIGFYHMLKYGQINFISLSVTFSYLAAAVIIVYLSAQFIIQADWSASLTISQGGASFFGPGNY